jgi:hypothetical protein
MNTSGWCIATSSKINDWDSFVKLLADAALGHTKLTLAGAVAAEGRGCLNIGLLLDGDKGEAEVFVRQITMILGIAKYSSADGDPLLVRGEFKSLI